VVTEAKTIFDFGPLKTIEMAQKLATDDKVKAMCVFIKQLNIQLAINVRKHTTE